MLMSKAYSGMSCVSVFSNGRALQADLEICQPLGNSQAKSTFVDSHCGRSPKQHSSFLIQCKSDRNLGSQTLTDLQVVVLLMRDILTLSECFSSVRVCYYNFQWCRI